MLEVESALLAEKDHELEAPLRVHDLSQGSIDRGTKRLGPEDCRRLSCDIFIDLNRCLRHKQKIS